MSNLASLFETALGLQRSGQWQQAAEAYQRVLTIEPRHARAMHGLGLIALAARDFPRAVAHLQQAADWEPTRAEFLAPLAEAHRGLGHLAEAIACYSRAIELRPDYADAHCNLGTLYQTQGDLPAAEKCYRRAISLPGGQPLAHHNLAIVLQLQGDLDGAAAHFEAAARHNPAAIESRLALGYLLESQGQHAAARTFFEQAVVQRPDSAAAHGGLGYALQRAGRFREALGHYQQAAQLEPGSAVAHYNLSTALRNLDQLRPALDAFQQCLRLDPAYVGGWIGVAGVQLELGLPDDAVDAARRAVELAPNLHAAVAQLAAALHAQGDLDAAIALNRRSLELDPQDAGGHGNLIYGLLAREGVSPETIFAEHRQWAERHADPLLPAALCFANVRQPERRLRVGYVSAHFREHAVAFFSEPMIAAHDHRGFEIYAYSDVRRPDATTQRFRAGVDQWRDVAGLSDQALAEQIRDDRIDMLVDLAGHIGPNRLLTFARKPAPVQVTYLGYQSTTGMRAMDYRLTDEHADPPGQTERYHTEQLVRLPRAFFCYAAPHEAPPVNELPALGAGRFTFASLNQRIKLRPPVWEAWCRILAAVPDARLLVLAYPSPQFERSMRQTFERAGVDPNRVTRIDRRPRLEYLRLHHEIDLALDSFPCNGHTTVCDALWMGVPSIMMEGDSYATRFGGSALCNLGLGEWIARTPDQYVQIAVSWAQRRQPLAELRQSLRDGMRSSPLLDAQGFTRNLEEAYRRMWRHWCESA